MFEVVGSQLVYFCEGLPWSEVKLSVSHQVLGHQKKLK